MKNYLNTHKAIIFSIYCIIFFLYLSLQSGLYSNPLINVNVEDRELYEYLSASIQYNEATSTIQPFSFYNMPPESEENSLLMNNNRGTGFYIIPLTGVSVKFFYTNRDNSFIEGRSGLRLNKGINFYSLQEGIFSLGEHFAGYLELREQYQGGEDGFYATVNRAYIKALAGKISFEAGIDNINLGPGEYGALLSKNIAPYPLVKIQTEQGLYFYGQWYFLIMHGWLPEEREDHSNPKIAAARISYLPARWIELGATRSLLYGGDGRVNYGWKDIWPLLIGKGENTPGSRHDNEGYAAIDTSLNIPLYRWTDSIRIMKLYYQIFATDIAVPWIEDETKKTDWTFPLWDRSHMLGINFITDRSFVAIEYVVTNESYLANHNYPKEGYTYQGLSIGYPYGRDTESIIVRQHWYITSRLSLEYRLGYAKSPVYQDNTLFKTWYKFLLRDNDVRKRKSERPTIYRSFASIEPKYRFSDFMIEAYLRADGSNNYDNDPNPSQLRIIEKDKLFWTGGCGFKYFF